MVQLLAIANLAGVIFGSLVVCPLRLLTAHTHVKLIIICPYMHLRCFDNLIKQFLTKVVRSYLHNITCTLYLSNTHRQIYMFIVWELKLKDTVQLEILAGIKFGGWALITIIKVLADFNLVVASYMQTAKPPNLIPRQIFRPYSIHVYTCNYDSSFYLKIHTTCTYRCVMLLQSMYRTCNHTGAYPQSHTAASRAKEDNCI